MLHKPGLAEIVRMRHSRRVEDPCSIGLHSSHASSGGTRERAESFRAEIRSTGGGDATINLADSRAKHWVHRVHIRSFIFHTPLGPDASGDHASGNARWREDTSVNPTGIAGAHRDLHNFVSAYRTSDDVWFAR